jgi:hypothetical protein
MEHFNPLREPGLIKVNPCPFCQSKIIIFIKDKRICYRCGKVIENKESHGN